MARAILTLIQYACGFVLWACCLCCLPLIVWLVFWPWTLIAWFR